MGKSRAVQRKLKDIKKKQKAKERKKQQRGEKVIYSVGDTQQPSIEGAMTRRFYNLNEAGRVPVSLEEFYDSIIKAEEQTIKHKNRDKSSAYAIIRFIHEATFGGKNTFRAINLSSFAVFEHQIEAYINNGSAAGSDESILRDGEVDYTWFQIFYRKIDFTLAGGDENSTESKYYICKNYKTKDNNCLIGCYKIFKGKEEKRQVRTLRKILEPEIKIGEKITLEQIPIFENKFNVNINVLCDSAKELYLYKSEKEADFEVLLNNEHYSYIVRRRKNVKGEKKQEYKNLLLFFDFETVFDRNNLDYLKVYSGSWFVHDPEEEFDYDPSKHKATFKYGFDTLDKFLHFINQCPPGHKYTLIGFNNSKFDNFFLAEKLAQTDRLGQILLVNNSLLTMRIGRHNVMDIRSFLSPTFSLLKACKSFQTNPVKVEGFSHELPQEAFEKGQLNKWIVNNLSKIKKYNDFDVLSLCDLTLKVNKAYIASGGEGAPDIYEYCTVGQYAYTRLMETITRSFNIPYQEVIPRPKSYKDDTWIRKAQFGGRTQAYFKKYRNTTNKFKMPDVKSLYPFVVMHKDNYFPIAEYSETDKYVEGKLGIYDVKIKHQNAKWLYGAPQTIKGLEDLQREFAPCIIPKRSDENPLDWTYREEMDVVLTSVDIEQLIKFCGEDSIEIGGGIYWERESNKLFEPFLKPLKDEKNRQDKLKGTTEYNGAIRETTKLELNSVIGKTSQRNFTDYIAVIKTVEQKEKFMAKTEEGSRQLCPISANVSYCKGTLKYEDDIYKESAKPSYLGCFVYAYARRYMYETILSRYLTIYQDTDSALMPEEEWDRLRKEQPEIIDNGEFGCLEEEVGTGTNPITLSPKCYFVKAEDEEKSKRKFKGVGKKDTYLRLDEVDINDYSIKIKGEYVKMLQEYIHILEDKTTEDIKELYQKGTIKLDRNTLEKYYNKSRKCMEDQMFIDLYEGKNIITFSKRLDRNFSITKDNKINIGIRQIYTTKIF